MPSQQDVITVLKTIFDPEIPVDIYELGLIYEVKFSDVEGGQKVDIQMTLTSPNCPVAESMPNDVKEKVAAMEGVAEAIACAGRWERMAQDAEAAGQDPGRC